MKKTAHYFYDRKKREEIIQSIGEGKIIDSFIIDNNHPAGLEKHSVTDNGIIIITNVNSGKLITKLIAQRYQIQRLYRKYNRKAPADVLKIADMHAAAGLNWM